jgi:hypothetical protein
MMVCESAMNEARWAESEVASGRAAMYTPSRISDE